MHAPHTTCPGCREEVFLDELIGGRCPLCGCSFDDDDDDGVEEFDEAIERADLAYLVFHYFLFKKFDRLGVEPLRVLQLITRNEDPSVDSPAAFEKAKYAFEVPMALLDRVRPKRCSDCGRYFLRGGKKVISGTLVRPQHTTRYHCDACTGRAQ